MAAGNPVVIRMSDELEQAVYVDGIWISKSQVEAVSAKEAAKLVKAGKAEKVR